MESWGDAARWNPEIAGIDETPRAWQDEFDRLGLPLVAHARDVANPHRSATVANGDRTADLLLGMRGRSFYLVLRRQLNTSLQGFAPSLTAAAHAAQLWLSGPRPGEVAAEWPFLGSVTLAEARERGDRRAATWLWMYENHCADPIAVRLSSFVSLAFHEPRVRVLWPQTSHFVLHLSATPGWPRTGDTPVIDPVGETGRYLVRTHTGEVHPDVDAARVLRLVLAALPA
jgi:hypothetical protein